MVSHQAHSETSNRDLRQALMERARVRANELRDEAFQAAWEALGLHLRRLWRPVGSWFAHRAQARADAAMWEQARLDPRVRQELVFIRDHAESMTEAVALARQVPALQPSLIVQPVSHQARRVINARRRARTGRAAPVARCFVAGSYAGAAIAEHDENDEFASRARRHRPRQYPKWWEDLQ